MTCAGSVHGPHHANLHSGMNSETVCLVVYMDGVFGRFHRILPALKRTCHARGRLPMRKREIQAKYQDRRPGNAGLDCERTCHGGTLMIGAEAGERTAQYVPDCRTGEIRQPCRN